MFRWLCVFGWHRWVSFIPRHRICERCFRAEHLVFYSDRTQSWVKDDEPVK